MAVFAALPLLKNSGNEKAQGIAVLQVSAPYAATDGSLITRAISHARIVDGSLVTEAGTPLEVVATPSGVGLEMWLRIDGPGSGVGRYEEVRWLVAIPATATVAIDTLVHLEPADVYGVYVPSPEVQALLDAATTTRNEAAASASAAATSATTAGTARDEAVVAKNAAQAVGTTTDGVMTGVDGNAASTFRVQSDARLSATFGAKLRRRDSIRWEDALEYAHPEPTSISASSHNSVSYVSNPLVIPIASSPSKVRVTPRAAPGQSGSGSSLDHLGATVTTAFERNSISGELLHFAYEWITDSADMELVVQASSSPSFRMIEDGLPHSLGYVSITNGGGGQYRYVMRPTIGGRKFRHFRLEVNSLFVAQLVVSRTDTIFAPPSTKPVGLFVGDSYTQQAGLFGIAGTAASILGAEPVISGSGGTGYLATRAGASTKFAARLTNDLATNPSFMVIMGGINDGTEGLETELASYFGAIRTARPGMPVFVVGPWAPNDSYRAAQATKASMISTAALAHGFTYIDNLTVAWVTGTGNVGAPTGDGNADILSESGGVHPSGPHAHRYLAYRLAVAINESLPTL